MKTKVFEKRKKSGPNCILAQHTTSQTTTTTTTCRSKAQTWEEWVDTLINFKTKNVNKILYYTILYYIILYYIILIYFLCNFFWHK
jgi:hypothetical protein